MILQDTLTEFWIWKKGWDQRAALLLCLIKFTFCDSLLSARLCVVCAWVGICVPKWMYLSKRLNVKACKMQKHDVWFHYMTNIDSWREIFMCDKWKQKIMEQKKKNPAAPVQIILLESHFDIFSCTLFPLLLQSTGWLLGVQQYEWWVDFCFQCKIMTYCAIQGPKLDKEITLQYIVLKQK